MTSRISIQLNRFLRIQNTLQDSLEGETESMTRGLIKSRLEMLEEDWAEFRAEHNSLSLDESDDPEKRSYMITKTFDRCREFVIQARATLRSRQDDLESMNTLSQASTISMTAQPATNSRRGLPRLGLQKFSGDYCEWRPFRDMFLSMVGNNPTLDDVEKMHYLKSSLTGAAAKLVRNISTSSDSYAIAWKKLVSRYENERLLITAHLDRIADLKRLQSKSARALNDLLSTVSDLLDALNELGCTDTWDAMLVHRLSRLLDADTRELWEVKLGTTSRFPTFEQFEEFLVGQARAWESLQSETDGKSNGKGRFSRSSGKPDNKSRSLVATTSQTGSLSCRVCKEEHYLHAYPQFRAMNNQKRRRIITEKRLCFNCFGTHAVARCSNTKRCIKCGQKHHSMIHESVHSNRKHHRRIRISKAPGNQNQGIMRRNKSHQNNDYKPLSHIT
ncbi:uncharacterized protein LOC118644280 [Monomorium pharaonis]|uniref:uncharacterized protein LOC118644280 n=1 Tax=Monomorium pharaonis TaxID=307658 RepID=UPI00174602A2|nr:uncharacterized protein LOC118644280 [Monomorium pharaonis]